MMKYTLTAVDCDDPEFSIETRFVAATLNDFLRNCEYFLKGAGFVFDGSIEVVEHAKMPSVFDYGYVEPTPTPVRDFNDAGC